MRHMHDTGLVNVRTPIVAKNISTGREIVFNGQHEAARELNIDQGNINHALKRNGSCYGWKFKYVEKGGVANVVSY